MTRQAFDQSALDLAVAAATDFLCGLPQRRVFPTAQSRGRVDAYGPDLPQRGCSPETAVAELCALAEDGVVGTAGPRYFGYVTGGVLPAALAANWLAGAWDQSATDYRLSPLAVRLEEVTGSWLTQLLGLPPESSVNYVTGSTMAAFAMLAAARAATFHRLGWDVQAQGLAGAPPIRVITGAEAHSTIFKSLAMLGLGANTAIRIPTDDQGRMRPEELPPLGPDCIVVAQAGNVNSGSFDPLDEICEKAQRAGAWVHVDGAFGLLAAASLQYAHLLSGHDRADSWNIDGHKWLNTPYDCGIAICRHPNAVRRAFTIGASYLGSEGRDPRDFVPELSRRARAIEVWAALRSLGRDGVAQLVERNCAQARRFESGLSELGCEILNAVVLNQCVARYGSGERTRAIIAAVQESGIAWFGATEWRGQTAFRINCTSWLTSDEDVQMTLDAIAAAINQTR